MRIRAGDPADAQAVLDLFEEAVAWLVEALVTSRRHAGEDIGGALIRHAVDETRAAGISLLRVECWAGAPPLVAWYERQGFTRSGSFVVLDGWHGQVLSMAIE